MYVLLLKPKPFLLTGEYSMLTVKAKITDRQLEPDDDTKFVVTAHNSSPVATAKDVVVTPRLDGGARSGVTLDPRCLTFGTIAPGGRATQEFSLTTKKASPRDYKVKFDLKFETSTPTHECDEEGFRVVPD